MHPASDQGSSLNSTTTGSGRGASQDGTQPEHARELRALRAQPAGGALEPAVLDQPRHQLGVRLLRRHLLVLGELVPEQLAHLDLEQRRDQHQELAGRLEVELVALVGSRDVGDHDFSNRHVRELDLLAQHQGKQQVERALEDVQVKCKVREDHRGILRLFADDLIEGR